MTYLPFLKQGSQLNEFVLHGHFEGAFLMQMALMVETGWRADGLGQHFCRLEAVQGKMPGVVMRFDRRETIRVRLD